MLDNARDDASSYSDNARDDASSYSDNARDDASSYSVHAFMVCGARSWNRISALVLFIYAKYTHEERRTHVKDTPTATNHSSICPARQWRGE
jgi:hypothetical protein